MKSIGLNDFGHRLISRMVPDLRDENQIELFLLCLAAGGYVLLALIAACLPGGIVEQEETKIFVLGWILAPLASILSVPVLLWILRNPLAEVPNSRSVLLFVNALLFEAVTTGLNLSWQFTKSASLISFLVYAAVVLIPLVNFMAILALRRHKTIGPVPLWAPLVVGSAGVLNFVGLFPYFVKGRYSTPLYLLVIAIHVGLAALLLNRSKAMRIRNHFVLVGIDILVILFIIGACFDPAFSIGVEHQNFYLGPANHVVHGGSMLIDTFSQYGVLVVYFLAVVLGSGLIPLTYQGFSLAIAVLMVIQYSIIYLLLISLVRHRSWAILLLVVMLLVGVFGSVGIVQAYASTGPLRFGLAYLILAAVYLRRRVPRLHQLGLIAEYSLVGIASLWSFETFVYTAFSYVGICFFESFTQSAGFRKMSWSFIRRLFWLFVAIAVFQGLFALATYARAGAWPDWGIYLDYIKLYSVGGFGDILIEPWSPWIFPVAIYFASLMIFVFRYLFLKSQAATPESELVFGLTLFGIAQYTYFLGRSHPNNLYHISAPVIIVGGYWFVQTISQARFPTSFRLLMRFFFFTAVSLASLAMLPSFLAKFQQNHTGFRFVGKVLHSAAQGRGPDREWTALRDSFSGTASDALVSDSVELLRRFTPGQSDATLLLPAQEITETLILSGRGDRFPINDPVEDSLSPKIMSRMLAYRHGLQSGDVVILVADPRSFRDATGYRGPFNAVQVKLLDRLCQEFSFEELAHTPGGAIAVRLQPYDGNPSRYCVAVKSLDTP